MIRRHPHALGSRSSSLLTMAPLGWAALMALAILLASLLAVPSLAAPPPSSSTTSSTDPPPPDPDSLSPLVPVQSDADKGGPGDATTDPASDPAVDPPNAPSAKKPAAPPAVDPNAPKVASLRLSLANPEEGELERLEGYLKDVIGSPSGVALVADVSKRLDILGRYAAPLCRTERIDDRRVTLSCVIQRARVLNRVIFETRDVLAIDGVNTGLPLAILENELRKRVLLRPGEPIDDDDALGRGRIARQRQRIEDFLEREGFFGAQVNIDIGEPDEGGEVDVTVQVRGGSFVNVRRVVLERFGPLSQRRLLDAYGAMCFTPEGAIDGFFVGNLTNCYNKRRLQATTDRFIAELQAAGYPEARVRVVPTFVNPRASIDGDDSCAHSVDTIRSFSKERLPIPPRCVDLKVEVVAGPQLVRRFHVDDDKEVLRELPLVGGTVRWFRETFEEPSSRLWQVTFANPIDTAADTDLVLKDLDAALTFDSAASVDETEARISQERVRDYLNERGYPAPKVEVVYQAYQGGDVAVDFYVVPGEATPLRRVRFVGTEAVSAETILDDVDLAAKPRAFGATGFIPPAALVDDLTRLRAYYATRGFPEADITVHATREASGDVEVVFVVSEGERFLVSEVILDGGDPALTPAVLKAIAHCRGDGRRQGNRKPTEGSACKGTPLLPSEFEADARRVESIYAGSGYPNVEAIVELGFGASGPQVRVSVIPLGAVGEARRSPKAGNVKALNLGEIFVEGNLRTSREVLLREMGLDTAISGARLRPDIIAAGVSKLRRTGLYSRVDVELLGVVDDDDTAHVRVTVEERPASTVDMSLGFSTQQLFSLRLEGRDRNFLGTMFDASAAVDMGLFIGRFSQVRTQIRWPRILGSDFSLSYTPLSLTYRDEPAGIFLAAPSTPGGQKASASWEQPDSRRRLFTAGTSVSLDWRAASIHPAIDDKLTVGLAVEARGDWLQVAGPYVAPLSGNAASTVDGLLTLFDGDAAVDPTNVVAFTPRLAFSNVDNPFDPKSGVGTELFVRTVPLALDPYGVIGFTGRGYWSFARDRVTLATGLRLRWGVVGQSSRCDGTERCEWALMQNDLLRPGGERSVRGTTENSIGQLGTVYDTNLNPTEAADGSNAQSIRPGLFGAIANVELRFSLIRQLFLGELKPAIFADVGVSGDDFENGPTSLDEVFRDRRYAVGVGAGLRYVLPVGPMAFDIAWSPFDEAPQALPLRFSFSLGYIF